MKSKKYILVFIVIIVVLIICAFVLIKLNKKHEINKENTISLIKNVFDYDNTNFSDQEIFVEEFEKSNYIGIRHTNDGWFLFGSNVKNINSSFSKEEIENADLIVFALSYYEYGNNKNKSNKVKKISSESVMLYYYNVKSGHFVIKERIDGKKLSENDKHSYSIPNKSILEKVKKDLGL